MKNWKDVPLPELMLHLEKDIRGFPIPYNVARRLIDNAPQFKLNDERRVEQCISEKRCTICGQLLGDNAWMVGGPISAFHPNGVFIDPPMHYQCASYALQVCPYMRYPSYKSKENTLETLNATDYGYQHMVDPTMTKDRVPFFVLVHIAGYTISRPDALTRNLKPTQPYLEFEVWNEGRPLTYPEAQAAWDAYKLTLGS